MKFLKLVICSLLALSLVSCAVSRNPNPVIRYGTNAGTSLAVPGIAVAVVGGLVSSDKDRSEMTDEEIEREDQLTQTMLLGVGAAAAGFVVGAVVGGTVGFIVWASNGFRNDNVSKYTTSIPEELKPPKDSPARPDTVRIDMSKQLEDGGDF